MHRLNSGCSTFVECFFGNEDLSFGCQLMIATLSDVSDDGSTA